MTAPIFIAMLSQYLQCTVLIIRCNPNRRIAAAEARIVSVIHPFEATNDAYMTMDEIEEIEQTITGNTGTTKRTSTDSTV